MEFLQEDSVVTQEALIIEQIDKWIEHVNNKDVAALVSLYHERAHLHPTMSNKLCSSHEALSAYFRMFLGLEGLHAQRDRFAVQVYGQTAVASGFYLFSLLKDGSAQQMSVRYSFAYIREDNEWKIISHHSSLTPLNSLL